MDEEAVPDEGTRAAEHNEANEPHQADRMPSSSEEAAADAARKDPAVAGDPADVAEHYQEMTERGARVEGEGRI